MTDEAQGPGEATLFPKTVGERLRDARLALKLDLADIAQRTRVPLRHLQAIEEGDYSGLPTPTYAVGFARAYARTVGVDEVEVAREVRGGSEATVAARRPEYQPYDIEDIPRTPSRGVMMATIIAAVVVLAAALAWYNWFRGGTGGDDAPVAAYTPEASPSAAASAPPPAAVTNGQVTLVAKGEVWVRIYDANDSTLKMGTMAAGERYDVPADAAGPMINTGRADELEVLVNGSAVAPLGDGKRAIKDVAISAAALAARNAPAPAATAPAAGPTPAAPAPAASAPATTRPAARPAPGRTVPPFFRDPGAAPAPSQPATPPAGNEL